ncbi:MAG: hypothetical protein KIT09_34830 [Bryobacteraceae bacterium]|nr:hypothetical protein [Bryobacteraceae bacterium]
MHNTVSESLPGTVSPRKLEANRANALKSTGPVSEAGKLRSSRNAKRHAALASAATLLARYVADFRPSSVHEETLVQEIAASAGA